jgi:hypothetical protein
MSYTAEISRKSPTAFLFVVDQSGSMNDAMASGRSKAQFVADALNKTLSNLITRCSKKEGVADHFHIGVIGYGGSDAGNGLQSALGADILHPISALEKNPLRIEEKTQMMDDGAGGVVSAPVKFPVWFEPQAGGGTPMCSAMKKAVEVLAPWSDSHMGSFPPTVLHLTDGESTDGDPEELAAALRQISTSDGQVLMFNLQTATGGSEPIKFPASDIGLPGDYARLLFRMSSLLPEHMRNYAKERGFVVGAETRGFMYNAEAPEIVNFFDIGTRAAQLR